MFALNGTVYGSWVRDCEKDNPVDGALPRAYSLSKPPRWQDFRDGSGAGVALLPVSNAMLTSWQEGYRGIRHGGAGTFLVSLRGTTISPKDMTQSRFSLIVHAEPIDLTDLGEPALVVSGGAADGR